MLSPRQLTSVESALRKVPRAASYTVLEVPPQSWLRFRPAKATPVAPRRSLRRVRVAIHAPAGRENSGPHARETRTAVRALGREVVHRPTHHLRAHRVANQRHPVVIDRSKRAFPTPQRAKERPQPRCVGVIATVPAYVSRISGVTVVIGQRGRVEERVVLVLRHHNKSETG